VEQGNRSKEGRGQGWCAREERRKPAGGKKQVWKVADAVARV